MNQPAYSFGALMRHPSAYLPLAMSFIATAILGCALINDVVTTGGIVRQADEGAIAHIRQLIMAGQMPIIAYFAIRWLPRAPKQTLPVLALQTGAVLASMAPVFFLGL
jgi:hypothetical protein